MRHRWSIDQLRILERLIFGSRPEKEGGDSVTPMRDGFFPRLEDATGSLRSLLGNAHAITNELVTRFQGQSTSGISVR